MPGVARVDVNGASPHEVEISIDAARIAAHNVGLNELAAKLQAINFRCPAGEINEGKRRLRVQPVGEVKHLDELRNLVINEQRPEAVRHRRDHAQAAARRASAAAWTAARRSASTSSASVTRTSSTSRELVEAEIEPIKSDPELQGIQVLVFDDQAEGVAELDQGAGQGRL